MMPDSEMVRIMTVSCEQERVRDIPDAAAPRRLSVVALADKYIASKPTLLILQEQIVALSVNNNHKPIRVFR